MKIAEYILIGVCLIVLPFYKVTLKIKKLFGWKQKRKMPPWLKSAKKNI